MAATTQTTTTLFELSRLDVSELATVANHYRNVSRIHSGPVAVIAATVAEAASAQLEALVIWPDTAEFPTFGNPNGPGSLTDNGRDAFKAYRAASDRAARLAKRADYMLARS